MIVEGVPFPRFSLPDQAGKNHSNKEYVGKWFLVFVYPEDDSPLCTLEACNFRDHADVFSELGISILGLSPDGIESHAQFVAKFNLGYPLLSDPEMDLIKALECYGSKKLYGRDYEGLHRRSFLVDPQGTIAKIWPRVISKRHPQEIIKYFEGIR